MARVKLTRKFVETMKTPKSGQAFAWDADVPGFAVRITPTGVKAWIVQIKVRGGKERRMTVGLCDRVPLEKARQEAKKLIAAADLGRDPAAERREARIVKPDSNPTFEDFSKRWLEEVVARRNRPGTIKHRRLLLQNHILPRIGGKRIADLTRKDIEDLHHRVSSDFPISANRCVSVCSAILGTAERWGLLNDNVATKIHRNVEDGRERYLTPDEIARLQSALDQSPAQQSADVVRLLILTGARIGEVLAMRWDQLDLEAGVWTKPAATTKQNKTHRVPLSPPSLSILTKRQKSRRRSDWVFPGNGGNGHMTSIRVFWSVICHRAKIKGARIHDLRHTFASLLVSAGESLPVIGALLGHTQAKTTSRYAHLLDDSLRKAVAQISYLTHSKEKS